MAEVHKRCTDLRDRRTLRSWPRGLCSGRVSVGRSAVDAGYHAGSGKRRQVLKQGFPTKKAAQTALADVVSGNAKGSVVSQSTIRVEVFLKDWLLTIRSRLRPTTFYSYEIAVQRISGALGRYQLQSLTPLQIEKFYADELASGGRDGGPLAPKTVRNTHVVLRKALADAERLDLVPRNAASAARPPATSRADMTTWSTDDVRVFFAAVDDHRLKVAFLLLATTGMRRGEVLGLRWSDVDLDGAQLAVANTRTTAGSTVVMGPPKTARSRRHIYLDKQTVSVLREHRQAAARRASCRWKCMARDGRPGRRATRSDDRSTPTGCHASSTGSSRRSKCHASASTTCATPTPPLRSKPASTRRSSPSASDTPPSASPSISIPTSCLPSRATQPSRSSVASSTSTKTGSSGMGVRPSMNEDEPLANQIPRLRLRLVARCSRSVGRHGPRIFLGFLVTVWTRPGLSIGVTDDGRTAS